MASEIAIGIPSGMATIKMQIARIQILIISRRVLFDQISFSPLTKVITTRLSDATTAITIVMTKQYFEI